MSLAQLSARQWETAGRHFDDLIELPPSDRRLDELGLEPELAKVLQAMLEAHDSEDPNIIDRTIGTLAATSMLSGPGESSEQPVQGRLFGPWRALEEVGRGGMAVVLRGERADGSFDKEVAIKLLPIGNDLSGRKLLMQEVRILARLEHPGIARLIDGGLDDHATPYLVMEYVHGQTIDSYCREHRLELDQRLALFDQVLDAVEYAHRHLVVHCDLKPSNILVANSGQVRLIDFGIADLIDRSESTPETSRGRFCSPAYAAPEQLRGTPPSIPQDVFSLGVLLYELLTGQRLRDNRAATRHWFGLHDAHQAPTAPSTINPGIDRDLDAICLKALAAEPDERYADAGALRRDLECHRLRLPVEARNGGRLYHLGRFASRQRWAISAAMLILAVALGGILATLKQASEARLQAEQARAHAERAMVEAQRAQATRGFLIELFESNDPEIARGNMPSARDLLDLGARQIHQAMEDSPELRAEMKILLGRLYRSIGLHESAGPLIESGLTAAVAANDNLQQAHALTELATLALDRDDQQAALNAIEEGLALLEQQGLAPGPPHARLIYRLVNVLSNLGRQDEGLARAESALDLAYRTDTLNAADRHDYLIAKAAALALMMDRPERVIELVEEAMTIPLPRHSAITRHDRPLMLADALRESGARDRALEHNEAALAMVERDYPPLHYRRALVLNSMGTTLRSLGRLEEAESSFRNSLEIYQALYPDQDHPRKIALYNNLATISYQLGRLDEAREHMKTARSQVEATFGTADRRYSLATANLGAVENALGNHDQAVDLVREALALRLAQYGEGHPVVLQTKDLLTGVYMMAGRLDEARGLNAELLDSVRRSENIDGRQHLRALNRQLQIQRRMNDPSGIEDLINEGLALGEAPELHSGEAWSLFLLTRARIFDQFDMPLRCEALALALDTHHQQLGYEHPMTRNVETFAQTSHRPDDPC